MLQSLGLELNHIGPDTAAALRHTPLCCRYCRICAWVATVKLPPRCRLYSNASAMRWGPNSQFGSFTVASAASLGLRALVSMECSHVCVSTSGHGVRALMPG
jgi:hypothetical protein